MDVFKISVPTGTEVGTFDNTNMKKILIQFWLLIQTINSSFELFIKRTGS